MNLGHTVLREDDLFVIYFKYVFDNMIIFGA